MPEPDPLLTIDAQQDFVLPDETERRPIPAEYNPRRLAEWITKNRHLISPIHMTRTPDDPPSMAEIEMLQNSPHREFWRRFLE